MPVPSRLWPSSPTAAAGPMAVPMPIRRASYGLRGRRPRTAAIACDVAAAAAQTLCMNGNAGFCPWHRRVPADLVSRQGAEGTRVTVVRDLDAVLIRAYEEGRLPAEMGVPWAVAGRDLELRGYAHFPCS